MQIHADDGVHEIDVAGIDRPAWTALLDAHPPRDEDDTPWNDDTFPPALIAACTDRPLRLARKLWDEWPGEAAEELFHECLRLSAPTSWSWAADALRRDSRRAAEVRAAMEMRIPHSEFVGWPVRDQDLVLAAMERDALRCAGCGMPDEDTKREGQWTFDYRECQVCRVRHLAQEEIPPEHRAYRYVEIVPIRKGGNRG